MISELRTILSRFPLLSSPLLSFPSLSLSPSPLSL
jgi:hypothetical protein